MILAGRRLSPGLDYVQNFLKRGATMSKSLLLIVFLSLLVGGCAWFTSSEESSTVTPATQVEEMVAPTDEPAPVAKGAKPAAKSAKTVQGKTAAKKGTKSEAQIKSELDKMGQKLVAQSSRTLLPNKAKKEVRQSGNQYVATYVEVDTVNVTTEMKPGANGQYVGFIRYQERIFECPGATRQAALSAPCSQVRARRLNELIRYDGNAWQD